MTPEQLAAEDAAAEHGECLRDGVWVDDDWERSQDDYERQLFGGDR